VQHRVDATQSIAREGLPLSSLSTLPARVVRRGATMSFTKKKAAAPAPTVADLAHHVLVSVFDTLDEKKQGSLSEGELKAVGFNTSKMAKTDNGFVEKGPFVDTIGKILRTRPEASAKLLHESVALVGRVYRRGVPRRRRRAVYGERGSRRDARSD